MMPLVFCSSAGKVAEIAAESADKDNIGVVQALGYSGLGFSIVFVVLLVLMAFITIMSLIINGSKKKKRNSAENAPVPENQAEGQGTKEEAKREVQPEGSMTVTLNGRRHSVTVEEQLPRFTVNVDGKKHAVDVEEVKESAEK